MVFVLNLGRQNQGKHLKCCLVHLKPTENEDQLHVAVLWYLVFCSGILHYTQISWHKLPSSSGCSSCWPPRVERWDVDNLCLWYIQLPAGRFVVPSRAQRCTQQGTFSDVEGTFFKGREKGKLQSNKSVITENSESDHTWCSPHFCQSSFQRPQESKPWRTGGRMHWQRATASFQHSEPSRHPVTAPQKPSQENKVPIVVKEVVAVTELAQFFINRQIMFLLNWHVYNIKLMQWAALPIKECNNNNVWAINHKRLAMCCTVACFNLLTFLPADPQVSPGEEACDSMPGQVMDPSLLPQLRHDGVDEGKPSPSLRGNTEHPGWEEHFNWAHFKVH